MPRYTKEKPEMKMVWVRTEEWEIVFQKALEMSEETRRNVPLWEAVQELLDSPTSVSSTKKSPTSTKSSKKSNQKGITEEQRQRLRRIRQSL